MGFRFFTILFAALVLTLSFSADAYAKKSFWDVLFGWMDPPSTEPDPSQTLEAPFAYKGSGQSAVKGLEQKNSTAVPLKHAHTNEAVVGKWLITAVSESLSHKVEDNQNIYEKNAAFFSDSGMEQFKKFIRDNNVQKVIDSERFNIRSFVKEDPLLLNAMEMQGRFRWLYEVPIMVSYMDSKKFDYKNDTPVNQHIVLTVQVGRVAEADNNLGVLIETWSGKSQKIDKN